ncbi:DUF4856 domain-containing protein [Pontibacter akesuensis]|uniref:DUF4856 domain-containing protein n=1 Tax=Pontibacter akesuensis TaxID=388950 RepID=A0A1I7HSS6_9BACT|nr:DUF4856 domain-containing protein [Pontibacter akesuensis]GHA63311.1 DUF4856 domain-containing protein [Pontibacter akesuensis]SFU63516.1 protein of unknown function [Pontibacter akesuensis]
MLASIRRHAALTLVGLAACVSFTSCSDDETDAPSYNVPETYTFDNVNYSGQTTRLAMLSEIDAYVKTGNTGRPLDAQKLKNMYANVNTPFTDASLNAATDKQLKNKTIESARPVFEGYFDAVAQASLLGTTPAAPGKAGILTTADNKPYLVDANGVEYAQLIQKGLMGAVLYFQAVDGYLSAEKIGPAVDNTTVKDGQGTDMEHHWDEAFGYFGAPVNFPKETEGAKFWANYSNQVDAALGSNKALMDAFLKGRAAISAKDMEAKDEAAATIRTEWERLVAASTIHELNAAKKNMADQAKKSHYLSEALGFLMGLQYKTDRQLTNEKYQEVKNAIGTNLYATTADDINEAIDILSAVYKMDSIKGQL